MSGFVERISDAVALVSSDGSDHDPDLLMVEALNAMVLAAGVNVASSEISIAVPAHWKTETLQALRNGLRTHGGLVRSGMEPLLVSDAIAALTAANDELFLAEIGVVALLDFGGTGTSATLLNLAEDFEIISTTMRYTDFSGKEIDQSLLFRIFEDQGNHSGIDSSSTIEVGKLGQLIERCSVAKERLSTQTITELAVEIDGRRCSMTLTRDELEDLIQDRLTGFIYAFDDMLARHRKSWTDLAAVVTVGGCASIPLVNERLSEHSHRPVVTVSQPSLAAARGALLLISRGKELDIRTRTSASLSAAASGDDAIELTAGLDAGVLAIDGGALTERELAWSQAEYPEDASARFGRDSFYEDGPAGWSVPLNVIESPIGRLWRRIRVSQLVIGLCALVAMAAIGGVAYTLTDVQKPGTPVMPIIAPQPALSPSSVASSPVPPPPISRPIPSSTAVPSSAVPTPPRIVVTTLPPVVTKTTVVPTTKPATTTTTTTTSTTTTTTTSTTTTTTTPTTSTIAVPPESTAPTTSTVAITTQWLHVPFLPVPIPVPVPQNLGGGNLQNPFLSPDG
nr:Hsp70 family protein [Mycobacterium uberis]